LGVPEERQKKMGGLQALWQDVLNEHVKKPYFAMVGGGDQIYCDAVRPWSCYFLLFVVFLITPCYFLLLASSCYLLLVALLCFL
jgi:hypothetical protein